MKRILSFLLVAMMLISVFPLSAIAAEQIGITATSNATSALNKGDTVEVTFAIANNPGFSAAEFTLSYDNSVLKFTGLKTETDKYGQTDIDGLLSGAVENKNNGKVVWASANNMTMSNTLFIAQFEALDAGDTTVSLTVDLLKNETGTEYKDDVTVTPTGKITVNSNAATAITLNKTEASLAPQGTVSLTATVEPTDTTDTVVWSSSNEKAATVDQNGKVTAQQQGTAVIKATAGSVSASCTVTVTNQIHMEAKSGDGEYSEVVGTSTGVSSFNYWYNGNKYTYSGMDTYVFDLTSADTYKISFNDSEFRRTGVAVAYNIDGMREDTLYSNSDAIANGKEFAIADVISVMHVTYEQLAKAFGDNVSKLGISEDDTLGFFAYQNQGGYSTAYYSVVVKLNKDALVPATGVTLDESEIAFKLGITDPIKLTATVTPEKTTDTVVWTSDDETVAKVDENGNVTAVGAGTTDIKATAGSVSASCKVTVTKPVVITYKDDETSEHLRRVGITGVDSVLYNTNWAESDSNVEITVILPKGTADGTEITNTFVYCYYNQAYKTDIEEVTCTLENGTAQAKLEFKSLLNTRYDRTYIVNYVIAQDVNSITLDNETLALQYQGTGKLTATVDPAELSSYIAWSSSDSSVVTVDGNGNLTAVDGGTAVITAKVMDKEAKCTVTVAAPYHAENIPSMGSSVIDVKDIIISGVDVTEAAWDGDILNVTLKEGTEDGTAVKTEFVIEAVENGDCGDYGFNGDIYIGNITAEVNSTISGGEATAVGAVGLCPYDCGSQYDLVFTPKTYTVNFKVAGDVTNLPVTGVTLNKESLTFDMSDDTLTETLTATISPDGATNQNVTWESSNTSVATVEDGVVTIVGAGSTTITVKTEDGGFTATCAITVTDNAPDTDDNGVYLIKTATELKWFAEAVNKGKTTISAKLENDIDLSTVCSETLGSWTPIGSYSSKIIYIGTFDGQGYTISNLYIKDGTALFEYCGGTIKDLNVKGMITGTSNYTAGLVGYAGDSKGTTPATIENCHTDVNITTTGYGVGGIASGLFKGSTVKNCSAIGNMTATQGNAGGIVGTTRSGAYTITGCLFTGTITTTGTSGTVAGVGGIVGNAVSSATLNIKDCVNLGKLKNTDGLSLGGIVGKVNKGSVAVENSYSAGTLTGAETAVIGGAIGAVNKLSSNTITCTNTYYLNTTATSDNADEGSQAVAKTEAELKALASTLGEGFKESYGQVNNGYPALAWQQVTAPVEPEYAATIGDTEYDTVAEALAAAQSGETVVLAKNVSADMITVFDGVTLDLNGKTLTAKYVFAVKTANVIDSVGDGVLKVSQGNIVLSETNSMIPAWNGEGYIFDSASIVDNKSGMGIATDAENDKLTFKFVTFFGDKLEDTINGLLTDNGAEDNDLSIVVRLEWNTDNGTAYQSFVYNNEQVKTVIAADGKSAFTLTVNGCKGIENLKISAMILSDTGAQLAGNSFTVE